MRAYNFRTWLDHIVDATTQAIIQQGTPISATNLNNIETGILSADETGAVLVQQALQFQRHIADLDGEIREAMLTNSLEYPFSNSGTTIALAKARGTLNYRVITEVLGSPQLVGDIEVYDKALNGFKVRHTGSAAVVTVKCYVQGGMLQ